jgi:hypothetical protein
VLVTNLTPWHHIPEDKSSGTSMSISISMKRRGSEIRSRWKDNIKMDIKEIIYENRRV